MSSQIAASSAVSSTRYWLSYRTIWRWHFYAGLFAIPFVLLLSVTGAIYLFKSEYEAWEDRPFRSLVPPAEVQSPTAITQAAIAALPQGKFVSYELPRQLGDAVEVRLRQGRTSTRVVVHPQSLQVLATADDSTRLMRFVARLHGELLLGDWGSAAVEIAACWTVVLLLTGLFLWIPRGRWRLGGLLYPRLFAGGRTFWRDVHSVLGMWAWAGAMFLLLSGLPWANFWGDYFRSARAATGLASARQDWAVRSAEQRTPQTSGGQSEHAGHGGPSGGGTGRGPRVDVPYDLAQLDRVVELANSLALEAPVLVQPPTREHGPWSIRSMTPNRPLRDTIDVDGLTGEIVSRERFSDRHWLDQVVGYGIAAHEGRLFGWANQLLGLLTTLALIAIAVSGVVLWVRRRPAGVLGAPEQHHHVSGIGSLMAAVLVLAILMPLFGASLAAVWVLDRVMLRRIPPVRRWLGLSALQDPRGVSQVAG